MLQKFSLLNKNYLGLTALISTGILSGCEHCIPVLAMLLFIPVIRLLFNSLQVNIQHKAGSIKTH